MDQEGWGPISNSRPDLTLCMENTILLALPSLVGIVALSVRMLSMWQKGTHNLDRTNLIYWPSQFFILGNAIALVARAILLNDEFYTPATMLGTICLLLVWAVALVLNHFEHQQEFRSSDHIFTLYIFSLVAAAINIRTMSLLNQASSGQFRAFVAFFAFLAAGFIVEAWPRGRTQVQRQSQAGCYEKANLFSRLSFHFLQPILREGYKGPLSAKNIQGMMPHRIKTEYSHDLLNNRWQRAVAKAHSRGKSPSLFLTIMKTYGLSWVPIMIFRLAASTFLYIMPVLLNQLLNFIESYSSGKSQPVSLGLILAFGMFFASVLSAFCVGQYFQTAINVGVEIRTALIAMVYRKSLRLSNAAKQSNTAGEISNHMSVDAERWLQAVTSLPMLVSIPYEISLALWLLYNQIGWSIFIGLVLIVVLVSTQGFIAKAYMQAKIKKMAAADNRMRLMNEILAGIKIVKLYGWEDSFKQRITMYRAEELDNLKFFGKLHVFMSTMFQSLPMVVGLIAFSVYATIGGPNFSPGEITPQRIFVAISLFGLLAKPIGLTAGMMNESASALVSTRRIEKFLLAEEISGSNTEHISEVAKDLNIPVVEIKEGVFAWDPESHEDESEAESKKSLTPDSKDTAEEDESTDKKDIGPALRNINLEFKQGELAAIVGRVGQGKSSLLNAIIGDMYKRRGSVRLHGRMAYVPQQAWILNDTVRGNILFGNTFDQVRYDLVLKACGLLPDMEMLPAGDKTEIGERGINLSGGQKQRVSLARAAYDGADLYLLDDPLSAVDAHVAQHLWKNLLGPNGLLKDKTRILVTHAVQFLSDVDRIVVLKGGQVSETGHYQELMDAGQSFYQLIKEYSANHHHHHHHHNHKEHKDTDSTVEVNSESETDDSTQDGEEAAESDAVATKDDKGELVAEEKMVEGSVSWQVYIKYVKSTSYKYALTVIGLYTLVQSIQIGSNIWLKYWVVNTASGSLTLAGYLGIYAALIVAFVLLSALVTYFAMVLAIVRAARRLHERLLEKVLRLPMSFFDTTPLGRIVNRFSSDILSVDELIPWNVFHSVICIFSVLATIIVIALNTPIFLAVVPFLVIIYGLVQAYYVRSSRALKRIDSVSKSPIYQHFSETLTGVTTIRALGADKRFIAENAARADVSANAYFAWIVTNRWLQIRLECLGSVIVLSAALFAVLARDSLNSASAGLALSYAMGVTQDIVWLVSALCDLQNNLVCVERIEEYTNKNPEAPAQTNVALPKNWPQAGQIEFRNYSTRYREGLDLVIKNIDFTVQPTEKVGIVGRTGAGKSSLTLALFRIVEAANSHWAKASHNGDDLDADFTKKDPASTALEKVQVEEDGGSIWIDGVDISTVGLKDIRQHLAIIPQEPILFVGTVRDNLDPFEEMQDADLWEALERAHLKDHIVSLEGGLSFKVSQSGENFSVGQRSLICLARALLRKTKILVLDEATAAVDVETDELIQKTIRSEFKDRTILTIAHRIKTVMDSDKILVLEKGRVEEFEAPAVLLQRPESLFYSLAHQAGEIKM
ncbi:hypothetical protein BGZ95_008143 [Linnemannia exigua]|uniref:Uncharacterized protein n=1 Tax=Linnemannia exigua TaxID=604196 RepID=A0AAD4DGL0_9FUNG|nr:hypothetical protein BGZ95_008143 [Linnemannia exigua]